MARTHYTESVTFVDAVTGALKPANNARVSVFLPGTTTPVTIYTTRAAGVTKGNPFTTGADGSAEFWAEWGDYDIKYEDLNVPSRFGTKTFGWSSTSGANAAIPLAAADAQSIRQFAPVGTVLTWWRPNNTVSLPTGWVVCDGTSYASGNHDFGTGAAINVPDMRNKFVLGANAALADAAAATAGDAVANAPGIRGTGSSHANNLAHTHTVAAHSHTVNSHSHFTNSPVGLTSGRIVVRNMSGISGASNDFNSTFTAVDLNAQGMIQQSIAVENWIITSSSSSPGTSTSAPATDSQLGAAVDVKPAYVGLLHIIKIKRD